MDEILYLEPDEEITSVIDKLRQSKGSRVSLVVPRGATILQSVINLKLLAKEAVNLSKEIAIVTADKIGRNLASQVGLVVYESLKDPKPIYEPPRPELNSQEILEINDQRVVEQESAGPNVHHFQGTVSSFPIQKTFDKEKEKASFPTISPQKKLKGPFNWKGLKKITIPVLAVVAALVIFGCYYALPIVRIDISVLALPFQKSQTLKISGDASNSDPAVFAGTFVEVSRDAEDKFNTTGQKNMGGKASGTITIYNGLDSSSHTFRAGTKLSSSSKTFILQSGVTVPGATVQNLKIVPGTVNANIEAENPGSDYNVRTGRFTIIDLPASEQAAIYGQSSKDLSGGFSKVVQIVSQEDYDKAKTQLSNQISEEINEEIQKETEGLKIIEKSTLIEQTDIKLTGKVGDQANDFTMHLYLRGRTIAFLNDKFQEFVLNQMEEEFPSEKMITLGPDGNIAPQVKETSYEQKMLVLDVAVTGKLSTRLDVEQLKNNLIGKNKKEVSNLLSSLNGVKGTNISYSPSWWFIKGMPRFSKSVNVKLDYVLSDQTGGASEVQN